jgi:hypothetical protein
MSARVARTHPLKAVGAMAAALGLSAVGAQNASAQQQSASPLLQGLMRNDVRAARYATPDGAVRFVFDRSGGRAALVQFEGDPEVHVLRPVAGTRGDELYRTEDGGVMLRVTPHGGITVYTRSNRTGAPVSEVAAAAPIAPPRAPPQLYQARMRQVQVGLARSVGRPVAFEAPAAVSGYEGLFLDAAERVAQGVAAVPEAGIRRVIIAAGPEPGVAVRGDTLLVVIAPQMGYAGRPSSSTVRAVLSGETAGPER